MKSYEVEFGVTFSSFREMYHDVLNRIKAVPSGTEFILEDLYTGIGWMNISTGIRKHTGMRLVQAAKMHLSICPLELVGKTSDSHQIYRKL